MDLLHKHKQNNNNAKAATKYQSNNKNSNIKHYNNCTVCCHYDSLSEDERENEGKE